MFLSVTCNRLANFSIVFDILYIMPLVDGSTAWKVSVFVVFLVRIFPHSDRIRRDRVSSSIWISLSRLHIFLNSVQILENADQRNSEYEHFSVSTSKTYKYFVHSTAFFRKFSPHCAACKKLILPSNVSCILFSFETSGKGYAWKCI